MSERPESEVASPTTRPTTADHGMLSINVDVLSSTISIIVAQAVQSALSQNNMQATLPSRRSTEQDIAVKQRETSAIVTSNAGTEGLQPIIENSDPKPTQAFTSLAVSLASRVSAKLKAKIWANEYVHFGSLLFSSPQNEGKYSLSMTASGSSNHPQVTLEPCHPTKRIHNIQQWVSAFNIFVSVYTERFKSDTPQLMKYCEVVRDLALKPGDWLWYDEQFQFIRQSDPQKFPWDQIPWTLWLRASTAFCRQQLFTNLPHTQSRHTLIPFSPRVLAGHFRWENTALGVNSNMSVINAVPSTQEANVPFKPILEGLLVKEREAQLKSQALRSPPVTPVKVDQLDNFLKHGYDSVLQQYLIDGFRFGFRINFVGESAVSECSKLKSALSHPDITATKIRKECDAGRLVGPFTTPPFRNFCMSPLGLVPKKDPNEYHLIHHLFFPEGSSVNDFIPDCCATVRYASIRDASKSIKCIGRSCFMAKTDIKSAFRIIPIHPADYSLLSMKWDHMYYFDRCLAMGLCSSCAIFEAFSTSLEWISIHLLRACSVCIS